MGLLMLMLGCTGGADYSLTLVPVVPENQSPFTGLDTLELVLEHPDGSEEVYELDAVDGSPELGDLGVLDGTTVAVRGWTGNELAAFGRSKPLTLQTGDREHPVLVSATTDMGWFSSLEVPLGGSAIAAVDGVFYVFGGDVDKLDFFGDVDSLGSNTIYKLDLSSPVELSLTALESTMPTHAGGTDTWAGSTATPLPDGTILVAGGGAWMAVTGDSALYEAFVFDPATETVGPLFELTVSRVAHQAVAFTNGDVALIGGRVQGGNEADKVEIYRADTGATELGGEIDGELATAALIGAQGILVCGGFTGSSTPTDSCEVLDVAGGLNAAASLPAPRDGLAMAHVGEGLVLASGGHGDGGVEAQGDAWLYDGSTDTWTAVGSLNVPRGNHRMVPLPSGHVLVVGGVTELERGFPAWDNGVSGESVACVELYDPSTKAFTALRNCSLDDDSVGLPARSILPSVGVDPLYGALVIGGFSKENNLEVLGSVSHYPALPETE